jgi:hypothetical protein
VDVQTFKSFSIEMFKRVQEETLGEVAFDLAFTEEEKKEIFGKDSTSEITDMAWDQGEDHLMVSYSNGNLVMVDFGGFEEGKTEWKFVYEQQQMKVNKIAWREDKSGDLITSSRKVGALRLWNAAQEQPKQIVKVGSHGVHDMKALKNDPKRILIAYVNGAVQVFNV